MSIKSLKHTIYKNDNKIPKVWPTKGGAQAKQAVSPGFTNWMWPDLKADLIRRM